MKPGLVYGNGDGTVNIRSLRGCLRWADGDVRVLKRKKNYSKKVQRELDYQESLKSRKGGVERVEKKKKPKPLPNIIKDKVHHEEFAGVDHMAILKDPQVIAYIKDTVGRMNLQMLDLEESKLSDNDIDR
jgi:hypothetical protein